MQLEELQQRAEAIQAQYDALNKADGHSDWSALDYTSGLVGDVGDLIKLVMAKEGKRRGQDLDARIAHEPSDILWSVLVIAKKYDINIEEAFTKTMDELEKRLAV